jgi:CDP-glucose 4,6-dehydratase
MFNQLGLQKRITHVTGDVTDAVSLRRAIVKAQPHFIFHLAAQSLVRLSYRRPKETYETNVMGTANVLEALRSLREPCAVIFITSDKCYREKQGASKYREDDALGGYDPYSSSKAGAEMVIAGYRNAFFSEGPLPVLVGSARSGNVIGGGDWGAERLVPDCIRSLTKGGSIPVRNSTSTRPWQHVLDPLRGYLMLGAGMDRELSAKPGRKRRPSLADRLDSAFNFGPKARHNHSVRDLVEEILKSWPGKWHDASEQAPPPEAQYLNLATDKARRLLGWSCRYGFSEAVRKTIVWYREASSFSPVDSESFVRITRQQIESYERTSRPFEAVP